MHDDVYPKKYLTVVMPAYNEGKCIRKNLLCAAGIIEKFAPDYNIIAVNDGSTDDTLKEIESACKINSNIKCISYDKNAGKGNAIKKGFMAADSEYIAYLDSDLELSPEMLEKYLVSIKSENADIVIGSKMHKNSEVNYPAVRKLLSFGYYIYLRMLFRLKLKDVQTGIKLFKAEKIKPIMQELDTEGFAFDIEILARASDMGYKIIEMPVKLNYSRKEEGSKSKISVRIIFNMFTDAIKIKRKIKKQKKDTEY